MKIQKMPWAGIRIQLGETNIAIDPLFHLEDIFGVPQEPFYSLDEFGLVDAVLVTHVHGDHFDPKAIAHFYGGDVPVYLPRESIGVANESELTNVKGVALGDKLEIGSLEITPTFAVDGIGDPQIAWVIEGEGKKIFHSGDTLWHGYWWKIKETFGSFDAVCLPVNSAVIERPGVTPSSQPITMNPEQAVSAAVLLDAETLIPIHYGVIHHPPIYRQTPDLVKRLVESAEGKIKLDILNTKESIVL